MINFDYTHPWGKSFRQCTPARRWAEQRWTRTWQTWRRSPYRRCGRQSGRSRRCTWVRNSVPSFHRAYPILICIAWNSYVRERKKCLWIEHMNTLLKWQPWSETIKKNGLTCRCWRTRWRARTSPALRARRWANPRRGHPCQRPSCQGGSSHIPTSGNRRRSREWLVEWSISCKVSALKVRTNDRKFGLFSCFAGDSISRKGKKMTPGFTDLILKYDRRIIVNW